MSEHITLGIETSCDDTGVALYSTQRGLIGDAVHSQTVHAAHGGVVPELASRDHIRHLPQLIESVLHTANMSAANIDAVAYTLGPGLNGALLVGTTFAEAYARARNIPAFPVHHMEGHLLAPFLENEQIAFPFLALLISGGHTQLIHAHTFGEYTILGDSVDDAVGEAFDKTAKVLGLGYPGGAALAKLAQSGTPNRYIFPQPLVNKPGCDFSFSGLKTYAKNTWESGNISDTHTQRKADIAYAFEEAVASVLTIKTERAVRQTGIRCIVVAGGVSANTRIRARITTLADTHGCDCFFPTRFCTDNGAMIAYVGSRLAHTYRASDTPQMPKPRWPITAAHDLYTTQ